MENINDFLNHNLDNLYRIVDYKALLKEYQQIHNYTNKNTLPNPSSKYSSGLDKIFDKPEFKTGDFDTFDFQGLIQHRSLKQSQSASLTNWTPDVSVFTPEGIGTLQYSAWNLDPLNLGTSTPDRISRLSYSYTDRKYPLRGPSGTAFTTVDQFSSAFWIMVSWTASGTSFVSDIIVHKSYFAECNFFDVDGRPKDVVIYSSSGLNINYSNLQFTAINPTYYNTLTRVAFSISNYDDDNYKITIDPLTTNAQSPTFNCYLVCCGSPYVPTSTRHSGGTGSGYEYKIGALRYIDDITKPCIKLPKSYDKSIIRTILTTDNSLTGLQGMSRGDIVAVVNQTDPDNNGLYAVDSGSWFNLTDYITNNFVFCETQNSIFTGSSMLLSSDGAIFDAYNPNNTMLTYTSDNLNPMWLLSEKPRGKIISSLQASGSVYEDFKIDTYSYDIDEIRSAGKSTINTDISKVKIEYSQRYLIPQSAAIGKFTNPGTIAKGKILNLTGVFSSTSVGQTIFLYENPVIFSAAEILYASSTILQVIIKFMQGSFTYTDLTVFGDGIVYGDFKENSDYLYLLESYQKQLFKNMPSLNNLPITVFDINRPATKAIIFESDMNYEDSRALSINPYLSQLYALEKGYSTDYEQFNTIELFGFIKSIAVDALEGVKNSPDVNFLLSDTDHDAHIFENIRQESVTKNTSAFITNSITDETLAGQEYDFNYLNIQSVGGETSTMYSSVAPHYTGPNLITGNNSYDERVGIQDQYGNPYIVFESTHNDSVIDVKASYVSVADNTSSQGGVKKTTYEELWASYTGPYIDGLAINKSMYIHSKLSNPLKNIASPLTTTRTYQYAYSTGSQSEFIFYGQNLFIPLPSTDYSNKLKACEIYVKSIGEVPNHGFLRAAVVDMSLFYETNDALDIKTLAVSDKVSINYLNSTYKPITFSLKDDPSFNTRFGFGQNLFLAIEKFGDFNPATLIVRCANQAINKVYQLVSGSPIYTNLTYTSSIVSTTGSSIYNLYPYIGNATYVQNTVTALNTFSMDYVRYPYFNNVTSKSYNLDSDYIPVALSGSIMGGRWTTGPGIIALDSALGINSYSFSMYSQFTGPVNNLIFGVQNDNTTQTPKGYHILFSVQKNNNDSLPSALVGLEKDFIYNSLMIPETTLYFAADGLAAVDEASWQDTSMMSANKESVVHNINPVSVHTFTSEQRKGSLITPRLGYTGPVVQAGIALSKNIDFVFKKGTNQIYHRHFVQETPGMAYTVYNGDPNGIPSNFKDLSYIGTGFLTNSAINSTSFTGPSVINTNVYINFRAPAGYTNLRITSPSGALLQIKNITTGNHTGPWNGPSIELIEQLHSGSYYSILATIYSIPANNHGYIEYYDGSFRKFNLLSGSIFTSVAAADYLDHPNTLPLIDMKFSDIDNENGLDFFLKRFTR